MVPIFVFIFFSISLSADIYISSPPRQSKDPPYHPQTHTPTVFPTTKFPPHPSQYLDSNRLFIGEKIKEEEEEEEKSHHSHTKPKCSPKCSVSP
jgi:hypothetical protein